jgi:hypothetical protein
VAIALVLIGMLAVGGVILATVWPTAGHVDQATQGQWVSVANRDDLQVDEPVRSIEHRLWLVKLNTGEVIALSTQSTRVTRDGACTVPWRPDFRFEGVTGWFRDPCSGTTWDINGHRAFGPAPRGLDQYEVRIVNKEVQVLVGPDAKIENAPIEAAPYDRNP